MARFICAALGFDECLSMYLLDKLQQLVGHVFALRSRGGFEAVVQLDGNVQIHSFHFVLDRYDCTHLLS